MTDIPIIFSAPMVVALLAGRKSMTRRLAWRESHLAGLDFASEELESFDVQGWNVEERGGLYYVHKPSPWQHVKPGDRLWVRESLENSELCWVYKADGGSVQMDRNDPRISLMIGWALHKEQDYAPSIHMPRWASRLTLDVVATKIERLQQITHEEAECEGIQCDMSLRGFRDHFANLWDRLHGGGAWKADPEVVALTFTVHKQNIDTLPSAAAA